MTTEKEQLIKRLLIEGKSLKVIIEEATTSWGTLYKVIDQNNLQGHREKLRELKKAKTAEESKKKRKSKQLAKRIERSTLGNQVKKQEALDQKVISLGYKGCYDYINQHGGISFRNNILLTQ